MPDESPIEFRGTKSGLAVTDWLAEQLRRDAQVCQIAAVAAFACGGAVTFAVFGFLWGVFSCGLGMWIALAIAVAVIAGLFLAERKLDGEETEPIEVDAGTRGRIRLRLSRLTGNSWLMYLDRMGGDMNAVARVVTNITLLGPRLITLGRLLWRRSKRLKAFDVRTTAAGLDSLMQSGGRVPIGDLLQEFPQVDPQRFVSELTTLDGVILLSSEPPALTLAPSLTEEYEAWKREIRKRRKSSPY